MIRIFCCYINIICAYYIRNDYLKKRHYVFIQNFLTVMLKNRQKKEENLKNNNQPYKIENTCSYD